MFTVHVLKISIAFELKLYSLNVLINLKNRESNQELNQELANRNRIGTSESIPSPRLGVSRLWLGKLDVSRP